MTTKDLVDAARGIVDLADECSRLRSENEELRGQLQNYVQAHANVCEDLARMEADYAKLVTSSGETWNELQDLKAANRLKEWTQQETSR